MRKKNQKKIHFRKKAQTNLTGHEWLMVMIIESMDHAIEIIPYC